MDFTSPNITHELTFEDFQKEVLNDFRLGWESRFTSLFARKEVLRGKAKFAIMGAGKEVPQLALSKFFQNGDFRSGYYRDQTLAMATGATNVQQQFSLIYADTTLENEPNGAGRQMSSHFSTRLLDEEGNWKSHLAQKNHFADSAPTASQMGRAVGLGLASKIYREAGEALQHMNLFSDHGNEVCFATIGDSSTSEGIFFEAINAAGVQQLPIVFSIWDDGYGISVPKELQTTKGSISEALSGFQRDEHKKGMEIFTVKGWDYPALVQTYQEATRLSREEHVPTIVHVEELTQPQGHSTSGSHERYKTESRLEWENEFDCLKKMGEWIIANGIATNDELQRIEKEAEEFVRQEMKRAWELNFAPVLEEIQDLIAQLSEVEQQEDVKKCIQALQAMKHPYRSEIDDLMRQLKIKVRRDEEVAPVVRAIYELYREKLNDIYNSHLYPESCDSTFEVEVITPTYSADAEEINGFEILNRNFDALLSNYPELITFGEDLGKIGGVNQAFAGLQEKHGELRVFDTGIREGTIMGQAIGLAFRGLRPIAEIQYLDYIYYGLQQLSDEVSTLSYRTAGGQKCPLIIRTRGHRLEGIWHSGSPLGVIIHALRGFHICVPRNMTQAAGLYNTLLKGDEPAMVIEPLNAYRLKEKAPSNFGEFTVPVGEVELLRSGTDVTLVTYGSCVRVAQNAANKLNELGISVELIDVQTLLPFDLDWNILESVKKTNRVVFLDEDVPGGSSSYMMYQVLELQGAFQYLDSPPVSINGTEHRPGYGSEHKYFSKPMVIDVVDRIYMMMHEVNPQAFPTII